MERNKFNLPFVVIFIPAYNEEKSIGEVIKKIEERYIGGQLQDYVVDIIVVDDGSKDKTAEVARAAGVKRVVTHPYNRGLGAATRTGMQTAYEMGADIAVKIDADMQNFPEDIEKLVRPILEDRADCVFGSRFLSGFKYEKPFYRKWGNNFFSWLVSTITGLPITDAATGLMAFHRRYLDVFTIVKDYNETQQLMVDSWGKHMRVMEVPIGFGKRTAGQSFIKFNLKYPMNVLPAIFRMYIHFKPLRIFFLVGLIFAILGIINGLLILANENFTLLGSAGSATLIIVGFQIIIFGFLADQISYARK